MYAHRSHFENIPHPATCNPCSRCEHDVAEHRNILSGLVAYYQGQKKMNGRKWKLLFLKKMKSNEEFGMLCVVSEVSLRDVLLVSS